MKPIKPSADLLKDIFSTNNLTNYTVPKYQRKYTWDIEQCQRLWDDLLNFHKNWPKKAKNNEVYFLGNIIVEDMGKDSYEVIDGQQRLLTLSFLIKAFLEIISPPENNSDANNDFIKTEIQYLEKCLFLPDPVTGKIPPP